MKRILSMMIVATLAYSMAANDHKVESFVNGLLDHYPAARLLDIYKSSFQDYMGAEHLVNDTASARAYLEQELASTSLDGLMPWYYEPCGVDSCHIRVSLRAVMEGFVSADLLIDAFICSANKATHSTVEEWVARWHEIMQTIDQMTLDLPHFAEDKQFIEQVLAQGRYAISHSPEYREAYSPHYRIVERGVFDERIKGLLP